MEINTLIRKKLNDKKGVSLSVSLLFFLVCAVLASLVMTSAYAAVGRLAGFTKDDQTHYALTSAAKLIQQELIDQGHVTIKETKDIESGVITYNKETAGKPEVTSAVENSVIRDQVEKTYTALVGTEYDETDFNMRLAETNPNTTYITANVEIKVSGIEELDVDDIEFVTKANSEIEVTLKKDDEVIYVRCAPSITTTVNSTGEGDEHIEKLTYIEYKRPLIEKA